MNIYQIEVSYFDFELNDFVRKIILSVTGDQNDLESQLTAQGVMIRYYHIDKSVAAQTQQPFYLVSGDPRINDSYKSTFRFLSPPKQISLPHIIT